MISKLVALIVDGAAKPTKLVQMGRQRSMADDGLSSFDDDSRTGVDLRQLLYVEEFLEFVLRLAHVLLYVAEARVLPCFYQSPPLEPSEPPPKSPPDELSLPLLQLLPLSELDEEL